MPPAAPACPLQGAVNQRKLMADFIAPVYRDDATGRVALRGPTMRVRPGEVLTLNLRNNLTRPAPSSLANGGLNGFSHVADTNMHVHGMHSYPGARRRRRSAAGGGGGWRCPLPCIGCAALCCEGCCCVSWRGSWLPGADSPAACHFPRPRRRGAAERGRAGPEKL